MVPYPHAETYLCPTVHRRRAPGDRAQPALVLCLYVAPLPDSAGQPAQQHATRDCPAVALRRPDCSQRHPCLHHPWPASSTAGLDRCAPFAPYRLRCRRPGATEGDHQALSAHLWQAEQRLDARVARRGLPCRRADRASGQWRNHPRDPQAPGYCRQARQALDSQSRRRLPPQKNRRDRLIRLAATHPTWALGKGSEVWWSRFARADVYAWQSDDTPLQLVEQDRPKHDPDPKALALYGILVRQSALKAAAPPADQLLLRFVDGRPVSTLTIEYLAWCSERLSAEGMTALLLIWDNAS